MKDAETSPEATLTAIDGRDALACVVIKPGDTGEVVVEAHANGIDQPQAAAVLRRLVDRWDPHSPSYAELEASYRRVSGGQADPVWTRGLDTDTPLLEQREVHRRRGGGGRTCVVLCGSTRFSEAFRKANFDETLAGNVVLTIGCDTRGDGELFAGYTPERLAEVKTRLDQLHLDKIAFFADEVLVLNVGGYVGESTSREIAFAERLDIPIRWLEPTPRVWCPHPGCAVNTTTQAQMDLHILRCPPGPGR